MTQHLLEVQGLVKSFGGLSAVNDLDFHVDEGEIVSIIGPNGAGKTTVFNLISGFFEPSGGDVRLDGRSLLGMSPDQITTAGIARTFQNVRLFTNLTILENVLVGRHCRTPINVFKTILRTPGYRKAAREAEAIAKEQLMFFGSRLAGFRMHQPAYVLSYANRRRLEIARAMATGPRLLLLDEPAAGMNPRETMEITDVIRRLRDERGFTVLFVEHDMKVVGGVSDRVIAMDYGRKIAEGSYHDVTNDEQVIEAYLGRQHQENAQP